MLKRDFESWCLPTLLAAFLIGRANTQVASKNADFESSSSHSHGHSYWRPPRCLSPYLKPFNCLSISSTCHLTPLPLIQTFDRQHFWRKKTLSGNLLYCSNISCSRNEIWHCLPGGVILVSIFTSFDPGCPPTFVHFHQFASPWQIKGGGSRGATSLELGSQGKLGGPQTRSHPRTTLNNRFYINLSSVLSPDPSYSAQPGDSLTNYFVLNLI